MSVEILFDPQQPAPDAGVPKMHLYSRCGDDGQVTHLVLVRGYLFQRGVFHLRWHYAAIDIRDGRIFFGYIISSYHPGEPAAAGSLMLVDGIIVDKDIRGMGIGTLLLTAAAEWAKSLPADTPIEPLLLSGVDSHNQQCRDHVYRKFGFTIRPGAAVVGTVADLIIPGLPSGLALLDWRDVTSKIDGQTLSALFACQGSAYPCEGRYKVALTGCRDALFGQPAVEPHVAVAALPAEPAQEVAAPHPLWMGFPFAHLAMASIGGAIAYVAFRLLHF